MAMFGSFSKSKNFRKMVGFCESAGILKGKVPESVNFVDANLYACPHPVFGADNPTEHFHWLPQPFVNHRFFGMEIDYAETSRSILRVVPAYSGWLLHCDLSWPRRFSIAALTNWLHRFQTPASKGIITRASFISPPVTVHRM